MIPQPRTPPAQVVPPPTATPAPTVQPTEPVPAPREEPKAAPPPAPAAPPPTTVATPISRAPFAFPVAAINRGLMSGTVRARATVNAAGLVTNVEILAAEPPLVFNRAAATGLEAWKFNPGADKRTFDIEIDFKR
jgi:TonB family protein